MSQENVEAVRQPLAVRERSSRTLDQRLALRFPWLATTSARLFGRLAPTSRIRRALVSRNARLGAEAFNRRDFEALLLIYHPEAEFRAPRALAESSVVKASYRGYEGYVEFFREWLSAWGDYRMRPREVIDLGDRIVVFDEIVGRGAGSGDHSPRSTRSFCSWRTGEWSSRRSTSTLPRPSKPWGCRSRLTRSTPQGGGWRSRAFRSAVPRYVTARASVGCANRAAARGLAANKRPRIPRAVDICRAATGRRLSSLIRGFIGSGAAKESNLPSGGLPRPAGFEDRMGHQTPAAPVRTIPLHPKRSTPKTQDARVSVQTVDLGRLQRL